MSKNIAIPNISAAGPVITLSLDKLYADENKNLRASAVSKDKIRQLADSIKESKWITPLLVKEMVAPGANGETHELVAGFQRLSAIDLLNAEGKKPVFDEVPVQLVDTGDSDDMGTMLFNLKENVVRNELTAMDSAYIATRLKAAGMSQEEIGKRMGKGTAWISYVLSFLTLRPEIQAKIATGEIPFKVARLLVKKKTEKEQDDVLKTYDTVGSASATERLDTDSTPAQKKRKKSKKNAATEAAAPPAFLSSKAVVLAVEEVLEGIKALEKKTNADENTEIVLKNMVKVLKGKMSVKVFVKNLSE